MQTYSSEIQVWRTNGHVPFLLELAGVANHGWIIVDDGGTSSSSQRSVNVPKSFKM